MHSPGFQRSRHGKAAPVMAAVLLAATLVFVPASGVSAQDDDSTTTNPSDAVLSLLESSFTSVPSHRSSDWTVTGDAWVRPPEPCEESDGDGDD